MLITFEGGECCGKDTQIEKLTKRLFENNFLVHAQFYEPGSTLKAEIIRILLKNKYDSSFAFPGDFFKTFDLEKYRDEFRAEPVPEIATKYLNKALEITNRGVKHEIIHFLLKNELPADGLVKNIITELNRCGTFDQKNVSALSHSPFDMLLANYFSNDILIPESQMYLYMAARNILHNSLLKDARNEYDVIIMNRSRDSSTVYQGHAQNQSLKSRIRALNAEATEGIVPNLTLFVDISVEEVFRRKAMRDQSERYTGLTKDFFDEKKAPFHEAIREGYFLEVEHYSKLDKKHPEYNRIKIIDGMGTYDEVHERIWKVVNKHLNSYMNTKK